MKTMRITGGIYARRRIECPPGEIRPAMDRMRESVFSILGDLSGRSFLDLFSGSGVIGIEAASRGASPVVLVESDRGKRAAILRNISFVESDVSLRLMGAERFLATCRSKFDCLFLDPPFRYPNKVGLLETIGRGRIVQDTGRLLIHHPQEEPLPSTVGVLARTDSRRYGRSIVDFYRIGPTDQ